MNSDTEKVEAIRKVLGSLGDSQFWTLDQLDEAVNLISDICDPEEVQNG